MYIPRYQIPDVMVTTRRLQDDDIPEVLNQTSSLGTTLHLHVVPATELNFPPPPPNKPWLNAMPDPEDTLTYTILSFYKFSHLEDPQDIGRLLEEEWKPFHAYG